MVELRVFFGQIRRIRRIYNSALKILDAEIKNTMTLAKLCGWKNYWPTETWLSSNFRYVSDAWPSAILLKM